MPRKSRSKPRPRLDRPRSPLPEAGTSRLKETGLAAVSAPSPSPTPAFRRVSSAAATRAALRVDYSHVQGELVRIAVTSCVIMGVMVAIAMLPH